MGYTLLQIGQILAKADKTMYKIGTVAYDDMFSELDEKLDYERDIIYIYKKAVEYADDYYVGTVKLDTVVEKLASKVAIYDYGSTNPIYSDATVVVSTIPNGAVLNDLADVTITNLQNNQILKYNASLGQWVNTGTNAAIRSTQSFTATLNQTVFTTTSPFEPAFLDVFLNGVRLNGSSYTTFGDYQITLLDGCLADDILDVIIYDPVTDILDLAGYVKTDRTLTINGVTQDLSANRTWTVGTGDMLKSVYDIDDDGIIDDAEKITIIARNSTGSTIHKGKIVYLQGSTGNRPNMILAQANSEATSSKTFGVVVDDVANNADGHVAAIGTLHDLDTRSNATHPFTTDTLLDGDLLWLSATNPGYVTRTPPTQPNHTVFIGVVARTTPSFGRIIYKIQNGFELQELHNVLISSVADKDILYYDSATSLWKNTNKSSWLGGTSSQFLKGDGSFDSNTYLTPSVAASTYVSLTGSYANPSWLTSLDWVKISGAPAFLTTETDPVFNAHPAYYVTNTKISNWDTAYNWVNVFPSQTGNSGKYLTTNGSILSWVNAPTISITSTDVINALGYTPYSNTNPYGFITGINSSDVTTALGYTPVTNARTLTINGTAFDLSADRSWTVPSTNIYNSNGSLTGNRVVTIDANQLVFRTNQSALQNYTFTLGTPTGPNPATWPSSVIFEGEYLLTNATQEPYNTRVWGRNQGGSARSLWVNQVYADITSESTGATNIYNQYFTSRRGSVLDTNTSATQLMVNVASIVGHQYSGASATTAAISTTEVNSYRSWVINQVGTMSNAYGLKLLLGNYAINGQNVNVTNYYAIFSEVINGWNGSAYTSTITNYYGLYLNTPEIRTGGVITNRWGVFAPDSAMSHSLVGNVVIGGSTLAGYKLDVQGTGRFTGDLAITSIIGNSIASSATSYFLNVSNSSGVVLAQFNNNGTSAKILDGNVQFTTGSTINSVSHARLIIGVSDIYGSTGGANGGQYFAAVDNAANSTRYMVGHGSKGLKVELTPNNIWETSALLQVSSTTQGFLPPRMTAAQKTAISTPATGLIIYQTDSTEGLYQYKSTGWEAIAGGGGSNIYNADGTLTGNRIVSLGGNKLSIGAATSSFFNGQLELGVNNTNAGSFVIKNTSSSGGAGIVLGNNADQYIQIGTSGAAFSFPTTNAGFIHQSSIAALYFTGGSAGQPTTGDVIMSLFRVNKNVVIGGTTDAGYKLDVQGTGRFTDDVIVNKSSGTALVNIVGGTGVESQLRIGSQTANTKFAISVNAGDFYIGPTPDVGNPTRIFTINRANTNVAIVNNSTALTYANQYSLLELVGTGKGFLPNRMTQAQMRGIAGAVNNVAIVNGGSGYTNGTYYNIAATVTTSYGTGTVVVSATVTGGVVTSLTVGPIPPYGSGYQIGDIITSFAGLTGGTGFQGKITGVTTPQALFAYQTDGTEGLYVHTSNNGWQYLTTGGNIYTADGTLTGNRTVTMGGNSLTFSGGTLQVGNTSTWETYINSRTSLAGVLLRANYGVANQMNLTFDVNGYLNMTGANFSAPNMLVTTNLQTNGSVTFNGNNKTAYWVNVTDQYVMGMSGNTFVIRAASSSLTTGGALVSTSFTNGNISFGGTTDAGYKLDVQGTGRVTGLMTIGSLRISGWEGTAAVSFTANGGGNALQTTFQSSFSFGPAAGTNANSTFIGYAAGQAATNAINSNFLGNTAGNAATNASYSNLFGFQAGRTFTANNIGSNNIIIGTNVSLPNGTANSINLGGVIFAVNTYSTTTGDPSIIAQTSGRVSIGTNLANASAILDLSSTNLGFLPPRMTTAQRTAISSPAVGLIVYQTDGTEGTYEYTSSGWRIINAAGGGGSGTVTSVSVVSANGFAGTVATDTTTPAITLSTTVTGLIKGNGTALSAAVAGTDYLTPSDVNYSVTSQTANYTETATWGTKVIKCDTTSGGFTVTLPTAVGNKALLIIKKVAGSGALTVDGAGSETIDGGLTATINKVYESITLISDNTNWQIV